MIVQTLENVEDMDAASLTAGIVWDFQTYPDTWSWCTGEHGAELRLLPGAHRARLYVMGDAAYERAATTDEIDHMGRLVVEAIAAGAAGFSTSFAYAHRGMDGKPVPSRFAAQRGGGALPRRGRTGKGVVLITPGDQCTYADIYELQPRVGRPFTYPLFAAAGGRHLKPRGAARAWHGARPPTSGRR